MVVFSHKVLGFHTLPKLRTRAIIIERLNFILFFLFMKGKNGNQ